MHAFYLAFTHWLYQHVYWAAFFTFLIAFLESLLIIGTIIPGSVTMTAVGIMMGSGIISIKVSLSLAVAGAFIGDGMSYIIGYRYRESLPSKWPFRLVPKLIEKGRLYFQQHGGKSVFIGRFVGAIRAMVPVIAGMMHMSPWQYFPISFCSAVLWAIVYLLPGFLIGYASESLPPGLASHVIIYILAGLVGLWLIYWVAKEIAIHFGKLIDQRLNQHWETMRASKHWHWLTRLIRNAEDPAHHGQFTATIFCLLSGLIFLTLLVQVLSHGPVTHLNALVYHIMRGLRFDNLHALAVFISALGEKATLLPLILFVSLWLWLRCYKHAAASFFLTSVAAAITTWFLKTIIPSLRPAGILHVKASFSFPSGHAALATVVYGYLAWLLVQSKPGWRKLVYWLTALLLVLIYVSRLYLGDHWFSDIVGAIFLALTFIFAGIIGYHRFHEKKLPAKEILIPLIASMILFGGIELSRNYQNTYVRTQLVWPLQHLQESQWWGQRTLSVSHYKRNLLNEKSDRLNFQWAGNLQTIRDTLAAQGWTPFLRARETNTQSPVMRQLELFPSRFDAQLPVLVMLNNEHQPGLVLRLWDAHITLLPNNMPLWLGTLTYNTRPKHLFEPRAVVEVHTGLKDLLPAINKNFRWKIVDNHYLLIEPNS